jgi:hypothetical protein
MSIPENTRRLLDHGDDLHGVLRRALRAEQSLGASTPSAEEAARLERIGERIAARIQGAAELPAREPSSPSPSAGAGAGAAAIGKGPTALLIAAALSGLVAIGVATRAERAPAPTHHRSQAASVVDVEPASAPSVEAAEPKTLSPADLPDVPGARPKAKAKTTSLEGDELALVAKAHDALRDDPAAALALCREHERRHPTGSFAQEREALAIEALVYLHRTEEARRRFETFERQNPSSSHRVHLESLLSR